MLTPGQILQKRRLALRKSISQVSQETKVQEKYLKMLESENYDQFASNVFINGFMKIYSEYLGLDVDKMLALYRRSDKALKEKGTSSLRNKRKLRINIKELITPLNIVLAILVITITTFFIYTISKYNQLQQNPSLTITEPQNDSVTNIAKTEIKGKTDKKSDLRINGKVVEINDSGAFVQEVIFIPGENLITIESKNNETGLNTVKTIRVVYKLEQEKEVKKEVVSAPKKFVAYIQVLSEATWLQLNIDDNQKLAQAVAPGKTANYSVTKSLQLLTGKPTLTKLYINNQEVPLVINSASGTASIECSITDNQLDCSK
ncbi:MAG: hypothetical protein UT34_C0002G0041 [candidate division WS6 bacterium GW2011_GWF2_39_15]|uniref:Cytoskeleton protein RodZ-like C-terminal domain-containing protein n=1 Tax=candidate division WS6 bacterium GW2011_GWF2_39_15 TaxID=1619100 RepID=A0A0G0MN66_9BACT|nr:MAG: hypothetical protein UT34_C0002G0041 [candidate division WS6 bacterium GW2011_GWF2_39_15]